MDVGQLLTIALGGGFSAALVSGLIQLLLWRLNRKAAKEDKNNDSDKHVKNALRILLYDRIKYLGRCYIEQGFVTADDLEDIVAMHKCYHDDLDGNGFLDTLMAQVKALPIHKN
jgi:hypothetical protein